MGLWPHTFSHAPPSSAALQTEEALALFKDSAWEEDISTVPGIGKVSAERFATHGIETSHQVRANDRGSLCSPGVIVCTGALSSHARAHALTLTPATPRPAQLLGAFLSCKTKGIKAQALLSAFKAKLVDEFECPKATSDRVTYAIAMKADALMPGLVNEAELAACQDEAMVE